MPFCLTGCSKSDSPTAQDGGPNKTDGGTCADGTSPPCPQPKVIRITAVLPGTKSLRDRTKHLADNSLRSSTSKENSLDANAPVVLVRGCTPVDLTAETDPPNTKVTWSVAPNENTETPP